VSCVILAIITSGFTRWQHNTCWPTAQRFNAVFSSKKNNDFGLARSPFYSYLKVNDCSSDMRGGCAPLRLWNELSKELRQPVDDECHCLSLGRPTLED